MWAASEIVIGSFLHNLRVPFSGSILTAIGVILLISISYKWNDKGLFWRAGLICALMKTLSPSAVIFGPMIAIISEAFLLELSVRILGRNYAAYITGAVLAMSWSLVQRVLTLIVFYGTSIIEVYTDLADMAEKQTGIQADITWLPILFLLLINLILGLLTALAGIRLGKKIINQPAVITGSPGKHNYKAGFGDPEQKRHYSIIWLFINLSLFIASMIVLNYTSMIVWLITIPVIISIWALRYSRAMRQLMNPKFWIFFIIITLITSFVFTRAREGEDILRLGLIEGLRMNFRAALIITGFSVLGTELYNPVIRNFFTRTSFRNLPPALELAVESLPLFIATIPGFRTIVKKPLSALSGVVAHAGNRLNELQQKNNRGRKVFIISGSQAEGKTSFVKKLALMLKNNNLQVGGILTERVMVDGETRAYDLVDIKSEKRIKFLRISQDDGMEKIGRYSIYPAALEMGQKILCSGSPGAITVIDEVGRLELNNGGWAGCLDKLLQDRAGTGHLIITVRDSLAAEVIKKWKLHHSTVINIKETRPERAAQIIMSPCNFL